MKTIFTFLAPLVITVTSVSFSWASGESSVLFTAKKISEKSERSDRHDIYALNSIALIQHINNSGNHIRFRLKFDETLEWDFNLYEHNLRDENYQLYSGDKKFESTDKLAKAYRGSVNESFDNRARIIVFENRITGVVVIDEKTYHFSQVMSDNSFNPDYFNLVDLSTLTPLKPDPCGDNRSEIEMVIDKKNKLEEYTLSSAACKRVDIVMVADNSFTQKPGNGTAAGAEAEMYLIFNLTEELIYTPHFDVDLHVVGTYIATNAGMDPDNGSNGETLLNEMEAWGRSYFTDVSFDIGMLFTYRDLYNGSKNISGKASAIKGVCSNDNWVILEHVSRVAPAGLSKPSIDQGNAVITGHELGHLFGAVHYGSSTYLMTAAPTNTSLTWDSGNKNVVTNTIATGSCLSGCSAVASFVVSSATSCQTTVQFYNTSEMATSYLWNFGDGNTSTEENPSHVYATSGSYSVTLTASGNEGDKQVSQTINVSSGALGAVQNVGSTEINSNGSFHAANAKKLFFDVQKQVLIKSVKVNTDIAGERTFQIFNEAGNLIAATKQYVNGLQTIDLNVELAPGNNYAMTVSGPNNFWRNDAGVSFPYTISGLISLTKTDASQPMNFYYYFYDWEVQGIDCGATGLENSSPEDDWVKVYPNPGKGRFYIEPVKTFRNIISIDVYDLLGKLVKRYSNIEAGQGKTISLDITSFPDGRYFANIYDGRQTKVVKIMKASN